MRSSMQEKNMWRSIGKCVGDYSLIAEGDCIAVGLSGGKDSLSLLDLLYWQKDRAPVHYELKAVTVDLGLGADFSQTQEFCRRRKIPYVIEPSNIAQIVFDIRKEKNPCSLCANLRRGALYGVAKKLGCNKVALAHHLDDAIETFFLNLFFQGRLACFHPKTYLSRRDLTAIRPLSYTTERQVRSYAEFRSLPIVPSRCPREKHTKRYETKEWLDQLQGQIPYLHKQLRTALTGLWKQTAT